MWQVWKLLYQWRIFHNIGTYNKQPQNVWTLITSHERCPPRTSHNEFDMCCQFYILFGWISLHVISSSGLWCYTYVWIAMLYLCLVFKFIPMSRLKCYVYVWFANLYLVLLYNIIPTSVMVTSVFGKFDFRPVIPTSGLLFYTYVCYIQFCFS